MKNSRFCEEQIAYPSVVAYGIPEADHLPVARELIGRFNTLSAQCAADEMRFPNLHFLDTAPISLVEATHGDPGDSGDWVYENHFNRSGLQRFAPRYAALVELVLQQQGLPA